MGITLALTKVVITEAEVLQKRIDEPGWFSRTFRGKQTRYLVDVMEAGTENGKPFRHPETHSVSLSVYRSVQKGQDVSKNEVFYRK
ncbi:hypothetical protein JW711_06440 [Candidatus Woesearchaeota archaeon]|nr:hypothetical protein [Candidatus Woesearchaeota archaeon]